MGAELNGLTYLVCRAYQRVPTLLTYLRITYLLTYLPTLLACLLAYLLTYSLSNILIRSNPTGTTVFRL